MPDLDAVAADQAHANGVVSVEIRASRLIRRLSDALLSEATEAGRLRLALQAAVRVAEEARAEWDAAPSGMRAGKLLIALSGGRPGYRADIDAIHAALSPRDSSPAGAFGRSELEQAEALLVKATRIYQQVAKMAAGEFSQDRLNGIPSVADTHRETEVLLGRLAAVLR